MLKTIVLALGSTYGIGNPTIMFKNGEPKEVEGQLAEYLLERTSAAGAPLFRELTEAESAKFQIGLLAPGPAASAIAAVAIVDDDGVELDTGAAYAQAEVPVGPQEGDDELYGGDEKLGSTNASAPDVPVVAVIEPPVGTQPTAPAVTTKKIIKVGQKVQNDLDTVTV